MRSISLLLFACLVIVAISGQARADIILYDQSGPRDQVTAGSIGQPRAGGLGEVYDDFTIQDDAYITGLRIWTLESTPRLGPFQYFLHADDNGVPLRTPLTSGEAQSLSSVPTGLPAATPSVGIEIENTFELETPLLLSGGSTYWLGLTLESTDSSRPPRWERVTTGQGYSMHRALGIGWQEFENVNAAFQVIGSPVPEPSSLAIFGLGALGLMGFRRRKKK